VLISGGIGFYDSHEDTFIQSAHTLDLIGVVFSFEISVAIFRVNKYHQPGTNKAFAKAT
jgi:hypothetical protein